VFQSVTSQNIFVLCGTELGTSMWTKSPLKLCVFVCVCVGERKRERDKDRDRERQRRREKQKQRPMY
jgi:hypothetical protein